MMPHIYGRYIFFIIYLLPNVDTVCNLNSLQEKKARGDRGRVAPPSPETDLSGLREFLSLVILLRKVRTGATDAVPTEAPSASLV